MRALILVPALACVALWPAPEPARAQPGGGDVHAMAGRLMQQLLALDPSTPGSDSGEGANPSQPGVAPAEGAQPSATAGGGTAKLPPQTIYRYHDARGREVYTNILEQVPLAERAHAVVDLRHISLNTELGNELDRRLQEKHDALAASPVCERLIEQASLGFLDRLWEDYAPLVVCGAVLLLFVLFTPSALKRFGGPIWSKTLMMAIPSLAIAGTMTYAMSETNKTVVAFRHEATPCDKDSYAQLSQRPDAIMRHAALVRQLQALVMPQDPSGELPPPPAMQPSPPIESASTP